MSKRLRREDMTRCRKWDRNYVYFWEVGLSTPLTKWKRRVLGGPKRTIVVRMKRKRKMVRNKDSVEKNVL